MKLVFLALCILFSSVEAFAQAKPTTAVKAAPDTTKEAAAKVVPQWSHGSLLFDQKTFEWIKTAIKSHDEKIPLEILLPSLFPPAGQEPVKTADPAQPIVDNILPVISMGPPEATEFYLKSIFYFSPTNWSLWLGKHKISDATQNLDEITKTGKLSIVGVSRKRVAFLWEKSQIDAISPDWKEHFTQIDEGKFSSADKNIIIDSVNDSVSFILRPNQTFISKTLQIVEGVKKPAAPADTKPAMNNPPTNGPASPAAPKPTSNNAADPANLVKNMETINSVLKQNVEKLR